MQSLPPSPAPLFFLSFVSHDIDNQTGHFVSPSTRWAIFAAPLPAPAPVPAPAPAVVDWTRQPKRSGTVRNGTERCIAVADLGLGDPDLFRSPAQPSRVLVEPLTSHFVATTEGRQLDSHRQQSGHRHSRSVGVGATLARSRVSASAHTRGNMDPGRSSNGGYPAVPTRVAQKLGSGTVISIPVRTHSGAGAFARKNAAAAKLDMTAPHPQLPVDALSLAGSTPPSSPTLDACPCPTSKDVHHLSLPAISIAEPDHPPQLDLIQMEKEATLVVIRVSRDGHDDEDSTAMHTQTPDLPFRKHNRGIGSIDSILSSTTCVNTHSECSRSESRLSRGIRSECDEGYEAVRSHAHHFHEQANSISSNDPSSTPLFNNDAADAEEHDVNGGSVDEIRPVEESDLISSLVLRNAWGKDLGDCAAPLLVQDCTYRYTQELWAAAHEGNLGFITATSHQASPSDGSNGGQSPEKDGQQAPNNNANGRGKRKAEGSDEGGSDRGGWAGEGGDGRGMSTSSQGESTRASNVSNLSCPYRKRNPLRFNVRDRYVCATHSFADMSQLKKHIRAHHPPVQRNSGPFLCPRCCQGFPSKDEFDIHLRQPVVCRLAEGQDGTDPEDGITQKIISSLEARSQKAKIDNWTSLWKLLFPHDRKVPDAAFVPVMEVFDFVAESKKFLGQLKDLLEIQYRYVLEDTAPPSDIELKVHQGLERSTQSLYTWIETVVQDWEQRISGTVSSFFPNGATNPAARTDNWAGTSQLLPPSPTLPPAVVPVDTSTFSAMPGGDLPAAAPRRQINPNPKRAKRANVPVKIQPSTQIPVPIQRAGTPQSHARTVAPKRSQVTLSTQPAEHPMPHSAQSHESRSPFHQSWESSPVAVPVTYGMTYHSQTIYQPPGTPHYPPSGHNPNTPSFYTPESGIEVEGGHDAKLEQVPAMESRIMMAATPRSSAAWIRDENRDSSQTLVEAHPAGRCSNMYCPGCSKTMPEELMVGYGQQQQQQQPTRRDDHIFHAPQPSFSGVEVPFTEAQVAWAFHAHSQNPGEEPGSHMFGSRQEEY